MPWSGFPRISAEAAGEYGLDLSRLALVPAPGAGWTTAVGALLDAVDVVAARPPGNAGRSAGSGGHGGVAIPPGDVRRLAARARTRDAVLIAYGSERWPGADVRITAEAGRWTGIGAGSGRLRARQVQVAASGRGAAARPRTSVLWLPALGGGVDAAPPQPAAVELAG